jgi:hypothetical protein
MPAPVLSRDRVHPLMSFLFPSEPVAAFYLPTRKRRTHLLGFLSPSRHQRLESTYQQASTLAFVPLSAFLTLPAGSSSMRLVGLFHPTATSEIRSSGAFPATQPLCLFDIVYPLAVSRGSPSGRLPYRCQILSLRLQGFDLGSDPLLTMGGLAPPTARSPLGLFNSFGLFSEYLGDAFTSPPLMTFSASRSLSAPRWPSAYQSIFDQVFCPQTPFPFEPSWPSLTPPPRQHHHG